MSKREAVTVNILDREYKLTCEPGERRQLLDAADYLDQSMRDLRGNGNIIGGEKIAVLAGLNIANEFLQNKHQGQSYSHEVSERIQSLRQKLDQQFDSR